jgi:hypothetical protein
VGVVVEEEVEMRTNLVCPSKPNVAKRRRLVASAPLRHQKTTPYSIGNFIESSTTRTSKHSGRHRRGAQEMEELTNDFKKAYLREDGYALAEIFTPEGPKDDTGRLYAFQRDTTAFALQNDLRSRLVYRNDAQLNKGEVTAWIDVFSAYWAFIGPLLLAEETSNQGKQTVDWTKPYQCWKDVVNAMIRGFQSSTFPYWAVPCLYVGAKYLRDLATKADQAAHQHSGGFSYSAGLSDDALVTVGKNENLEDAARQLNRMFSTCLSDRFVASLPSTGQLLTSSGHPSRSQENGASCTLRTQCLRYTSKSEVFPFKSNRQLTAIEQFSEQHGQECPPLARRDDY